MKFCPNCDSILVPKKDNKRTILKCSSCQYSEKSEDNKISEKQVNVSRALGVASDKNLNAVNIHTCTKCGHNKAELVKRWSEFSDEDDIILWKCGKCGFTEREENKER